MPITSRVAGRLEGLKVLAVMGDGEGIDLDKDLSIINSPNNPDIFVRPLRQPDIETLRKELETGCWDVLFFSGHSETINGKGILYLGHGESIFIAELKNSFRKAISEGLQLAIFNSCDGIGPAKDIQDCQIPQTIVMREPIPDKVAHAFLAAYIEGIQELERNSPLYLAERYARQKIADKLTCADWLPIIFQNHKVCSPVRGNIRKSKYPDSSRPDPYDDIRKNLQITLETKPKNCKVIQSITKDSVGEIYHSGSLWKASIFPMNLYGISDEIFFPGDEVFVMARKGNLCFVLSSEVLKSNTIWREIKKTINEDNCRKNKSGILEIPGLKMHLIVCFFMGVFGMLAISCSHLFNGVVANNMLLDAPQNEAANESVERAK